MPDWLITSSRADETGAAGVLGAGWVFHFIFRFVRYRLTSFQCVGRWLELERSYVLAVLNENTNRLE